MYSGTLLPIGHFFFTFTQTSQTSLNASVWTWISYLLFLRYYEDNTCSNSDLRSVDSSALRMI